MSLRPTLVQLKSRAVERKVEDRAAAERTPDWVGPASPRMEGLSRSQRDQCHVGGQLSAQGFS